MTVTDEKTLDRYRGPGLCALCSKWCQQRDPHHCYKTRGAGRLDLIENCAPLCPGPYGCHAKCHASHAVNREVQELIAQRERRAHGAKPTTETIMDYLNLVLRTPKEDGLPKRPWRRT